MLIWYVRYADITSVVDTEEYGAPLVRAAEIILSEVILKGVNPSMIYSAED